MAEITPYEENELLHKIAAGDEKAFTRLVDQYGALVFNFIRKHTRSGEVAEEIVQDIFTQIWLVRDTLPQVRNFKPFLYVISRNYALNALKKLTREKRRQEEWEQNISHEPGTRSAEEDDDNEQINLITRAAAALPPQQQKVWILSRREGLRHSEIAEQMNLSPASVKKYMQWANAFIIKYVEDRVPVLVALALIEISEKNMDIISPCTM